MADLKASDKTPDSKIDVEAPDETTPCWRSMMEASMRREKGVDVDVEVESP